MTSFYLKSLPVPATNIWESSQGSDQDKGQKRSGGGGTGDDRQGEAREHATRIGPESLSGR